MNRHNWTQEEDQQLRQVVHKNGSIDWTKNAELLRYISTTAELKKRTGKQCRERWYNHLDPAVVKTQWAIHEEAKLFQMHKTHGNKWKQLTKYLPGRTDNDIKNHFYSTLRRSLRRLNKYSGEKNSTSQMREIKPSVLTFIINHIYSQDGISPQNRNLIDSLKELPELIFKFSNFKPVKHNMDKKIDDCMRDRIGIIMNLVEQFKELYRKDKNQDIDHQSQRRPKIKLENHHTVSFSIQENSIKLSSPGLDIENQEDVVQNYTSNLKQEHQSENDFPEIGSFEQAWISNSKITKSSENREFAPIVTIQRKISTNQSKPIPKKLIILPKTEHRLDQRQRSEQKLNLRTLSFHEQQDINDRLMPIEQPSVSLHQNEQFLNDLVVIGKHIEPTSCLAPNQPHNMDEIDEILYENYQD